MINNSMRAIALAFLMSSITGMAYGEATSVTITNDMPLGKEYGIDVKVVGDHNSKYGFRSYFIYPNLAKGRSTLAIPVSNDWDDKITTLQIRKHQDGEGSWDDAVSIDGSVLNDALYSIKIYLDRRREPLLKLDTHGSVRFIGF